MGELSIRDLMRAGHVTRWQIVRTSRNQTLAEHLFNVTMISLELAERLFPDADCSDKYAIMDWALHHDIPEVYLGDISTPVKQRVKESGGADVFNNLERGVSEKWWLAKERVEGHPFKDLVKLADIIDGVLFMQIEGIGTHAETVRKKLDLVYNELVEKAKKRWPEYKWEQAMDVYWKAVSGSDGTLEFEYRN